MSFCGDDHRRDATVVIQPRSPLMNVDIQGAVDGALGGRIVVAPRRMTDVAGTAMAPQRGEKLGVRPAWLTAEQYGPVSILAVWEAAYAEPLDLVTTMLDLQAALALYRKRAPLEPFFSDQTSRGFHIPKRHLRDAERLTRLLIAACLAYLWLV